MWFCHISRYADSRLRVRRGASINGEALRLRGGEFGAGDTLNRAAVALHIFLIMFVGTAGCAYFVGDTTANNSLFAK
jgi:hypothetical protein